MPLFRKSPHSTNFDSFRAGQVRIDGGNDNGDGEELSMGLE